MCVGLLISDAVARAPSRAAELSRHETVLTIAQHKHFHRVSAVASTSVHAVAELYPGFTYRAPIVPAEMRIVHLGRSDVRRARSSRSR